MLRDLLQAGRWLGKNPLFGLAVIAILTLGIGVNTAVFSVVDAVLLKPLPYPLAGRLVRIEETSTRRASLGTSSRDVVRWRERGDLFDAVLAYRRDLTTLTAPGEPDQIWIMRTEARLFSLLGSRSQLGRTLVDADNRPASGNPAVLSSRLWSRLFHSDPNAIGKTLTLDSEIYTVVGVMPRDFEFPNPEIELWTPLRLAPSADMAVEVIARTRKGLPLSQVQSAMAIVAHQLEQEQPIKQPGLRIEVSPWSEVRQGELRLTLILVMAAVGLVLLIACADAARLLLSRAVRRQKEIAIRASLGAGFWRVLRQLLAESLILAVAASIAGVAVAHLILRILVKQMAALPTVLPHLARVGIDGRVLTFCAGVCLILTLLSSAAPVLLSARLDLQSLLRGGNVFGSARRSARLFSFLIGAEAAFAMLLLVGSGLMVRSLIRLERTDHGIRPDHVLTMRVPIGSATDPKPKGNYDSKPRQVAYYRELVERLRTVPGVSAVAVVNNLPLSNSTTSVFVKGPDGQPLLNSTRTISPEYFAVMGIARLAGRSFSDADRTGAAPVVIINRFMARQLFGSRDPIGQPLPSLEAHAPTVVGVVADSPQLSYDRPPKGELYLPYQQTIFGVFLSTIVVRTSGDPLALAGALRREIWAVDPDQPIVRVETMNDVVAASIWRPRFSAWIFSILGGLALLLTSAGVYAIITYTSALRVREVGIRAALGASAPRIVMMVMRSALVPLSIGLGAGMGAALLLSRYLAGLLYGIRGNDPAAYLGAAVLLLAIGALASARPAWRAAMGDPVQALRAE